MEINLKKQILTYSFAFALVMGIYAGATHVSAQMTGAYGDASVGSKEVKRAAKFAVSQQSTSTKAKLTLVQIVKAEQQVVAGMNYRLILTVADKHGKKSTATTVVYQDLKNHLSLTSWKAGDHE